jgi:hypothetical protein
MTAVTRRAQSTPMAPYLGVMKSMNVSDIDATMDFLIEAKREAEDAKRQAEDEFLAKKMAEIKISPRIQKLIAETRLSSSDTEDERTRYILGIDKR